MRMAKSILPSKSASIPTTLAPRQSQDIGEMKIILWEPWIYEELTSSIAADNTHFFNAIMNAQMGSK